VLCEAEISLLFLLLAYLLVADLLTKKMRSSFHAVVIWRSFFCSNFYLALMFDICQSCPSNWIELFTYSADLRKIWNEVFCAEATPIEYAEILDNLRSKFYLG